jgi:ABC-type bacteriocin/lantibiotic exporter with double-glycine peptidase domain
LISDQYLRLWKAINNRRRAQMGLLIAFTLLASFAEVFSIGAVLPLMAVLSSPQNVFKHDSAQPFIQALGIGTPQDLLLPITALFCAVTLVAAIIRIATVWLRTRLTFAIGADLSNEIYYRTLHQPYAVHLARNSSEMIAGISGKARAVISGTLSPLLVIVSNSVMLIVIVLALLLLRPLTALICFGGIGLIYLAIHKVSRMRLQANSRRVAESSTQIIKCLQEGLGGIRDILLDHSQAVYCAAYKRADSRLRRAQSENLITSEVPRYVVEALGICLIALLALKLAYETEKFQLVLPLLGAIAVAAQRLLPLLQQIYQACTSLNGSDQSLRDTLDLLEQPLPEIAHQSRALPLKFENRIEFRQLGFKYHSDGPWVLRNLNLTIQKGARIGLIGTTGSGKSTLLDILMGLLHPSEGTLEVDGEAINSISSLGWQTRIAHVPQSVYLSDANVAENIAFGVPSELIDINRVREVAARAQIAETIDRMPLGYETLVGERGVRLSGGQRQRIGIARALYRKADVLIFDEATSALDNQTEIAVMQAIEALGRDLTVLIVAHRLTTLKQCDAIIELSCGRVQRTGSYSAILDN